MHSKHVPLSVLLSVHVKTSDTRTKATIHIYKHSAIATPSMRNKLIFDTWLRQLNG